MNPLSVSPEPPRVAAWVGWDWADQQHVICLYEVATGQSTITCLEQKPEAEFDKCYIGSQVMAHMAMVDTLEVFSRHASPELKSVLEKGKQTAQMHLDEAKKLEQQLEKGAESGQRERANP